MIQVYSQLETPINFTIGVFLNKNSVVSKFEDPIITELLPTSYVLLDISSNDDVCAEAILRRAECPLQSVTVNGYRFVPT